MTQLFTYINYRTFHIYLQVQSLIQRINSCVGKIRLLPSSSGFFLRKNRIDVNEVLIELSAKYAQIMSSFKLLSHASNTNCNFNEAETSLSTLIKLTRPSGNQANSACGSFHSKYNFKLSRRLSCVVGFHNNKSCDPTSHNRNNKNIHDSVKNQCVINPTFFSTIPIGITVDIFIVQ